MIELEAVIDPETVAPAAHPRRRRALVASVTLLAVVAGAIAVAGGGGGSEPKLALMAGNGTGAETMAARNDSPAPAIAAAQGAAADSREAIYPYGGWGMQFEVEGRLPDLPDHAAAWRVNGPALDRAAVVRIAGAFGLTGEPVERDGAWFVESGEWTLSANSDSGQRGPGSVNLYRSHPDGRVDTASGPPISRADAERRVRDLLDRMDAPTAPFWKVEVSDTEIGTVWGCAAPALSPDELKKLEAEKLRQVGQPASAANSAGAAVAAPTPADMPTPTGKPAPDGNVTSCPPPPAPVKGFAVAFFPVLDGNRGDWPVWNVTLRTDGAVENVYGSWVTFERAGSYKLRGVDAALKDLQSPPVAYATDLPAVVAAPAVAPPAQASAGAIEGSGAAGSAPSRMPVDGVTPSSAVSVPAVAPCPPIPMPMPAEDGNAVAPMMACAPPQPQVVRVTGVELGLMQTSVFEDGRVRLAMVPSYRFTGHFDNGSPWSTSVIALHPDAIAPPPDYPVVDDVRSSGGGGVTGVGKAIPPTPPAAEPAPVKQ